MVTVEIARYKKPICKPAWPLINHLPRQWLSMAQLEPRTRAESVDALLNRPSHMGMATNSTWCIRAHTPNKSHVEIPLKNTVRNLWIRGKLDGRYSAAYRTSSFASISLAASSSLYLSTWNRASPTSQEFHDIVIANMRVLMKTQSWPRI